MYWLYIYVYNMYIYKYSLTFIYIYIYIYIYIFNRMIYQCVAKIISGMANCLCTTCPTCLRISNNPRIESLCVMVRHAFCYIYMYIPSPNIILLCYHVYRDGTKPMIAMMPCLGGFASIYIHLPAILMLTHVLRVLTHNHVLQLWCFPVMSRFLSPTSIASRWLSVMPLFR